MAEFVKKTNKNKNFNGKKNIANNKRNNNNNKKRKDYVIPADVYAAPIEYKMPKAMAQNILKDAKGKGNPQAILCDYVNTQCGLMGYCVRVIVS